jgi:hypothetical protein
VTPLSLWTTSTVAQFLYLLLNNKHVRDVIDTITSKVVLILGRFTQERKRILDALRNELHQRNYSLILFDFEKPASRDLAETISTLAHVARFIIADLTDAKSLPQELQRIVPIFPEFPVERGDKGEANLFLHVYDSKRSRRSLLRSVRLRRFKNSNVQVFNLLFIERSIRPVVEARRAENSGRRAGRPRRHVIKRGNVRATLLHQSQALEPLLIFAERG